MENKARFLWKPDEYKKRAARLDIILYWTLISLCWSISTRKCWQKSKRIVPKAHVYSGWSVTLVAEQDVLSILTSRQLLHYCRLILISSSMHKIDRRLYLVLLSNFRKFNIKITPLPFINLWKFSLKRNTDFPPVHYVWFEWKSWHSLTLIGKKVPPQTIGEAKKRWRVLKKITEGKGLHAVGQQFGFTTY